MNKKEIKLVSTLMSLFILILFLISIIYKEQIASLLTSQEGFYGVAIFLFFSLLMDLIPQYLSPHFLIINAAILKIPLFYPTFFVILGSFIGSVLGFELGKKGSFLIYQRSDLSKTKLYIKKYGKYFMALAAISPLPYFPVVFGTLGIKRIEFLIFGLIPRIIGLVLLGIWLNFI